MTGKIISGYPDYIIYEDGNVFSLKSDKFLKPMESNKQLIMRLYNGKWKNIPLHSLVMEHFGASIEKTRYIKHLDLNKRNNHINNLKYCEFKELLNPDKKRAKGKKRKRVISFESKVEAYKYYCQSVPTAYLRGHLSIMRHRIEFDIIRIRWANKHSLNEGERAFQKYCSGESPKAIMAFFGWSSRKYTKVFNDIRSQLISEIMQDVINGRLVYVHIPVPTDKASVKEWDKYIATFNSD